MEWVETTGITVAEATERALDRLGVSEADAEVVILEEPRRSMLGLRKSEARVRARVRPVQAKAKRPARRNQNGEQRSRRRAGERSESKRRSQADSEMGPSETAPSRDQAGNEKAQENRRETRGRSGGEAEPAGRRSEPEGERAAEQGGNPAQKARPRSRSRGTAGNGSRVTRPAGDSNRRPRETTTEEDQMSIESQAELAEQFVKGVVERFGFDAELSRTIEDETVRIDVNGESLGLLIGPRGATVDALQELARTAVQRRGEDASVRLVVDVGGYRVRRAAALQQFARRVAREVAETGQPQALDPMSAADRKIVHDAVNEIGTVHTTSEGQDPRRYVVIHPGPAEHDGARDGS